MADEKNSNESGGSLRTVTLTNAQWNKLYMYLLSTTKYRREQAEAWERLSHETNLDGSTKYPNAAPNAEYCRQLEHDLSEIIQKIC